MVNSQPTNKRLGTNKQIINKQTNEHGKMKHVFSKLRGVDALKLFSFF